MKDLPSVRYWIYLAVILPGIAHGVYPEDPDDAATEAAARAAVVAIGEDRGGLELGSAPAQSLSGEVVGIIGVQSALSGKITPLAQAIQALDARVMDTLIEVGLSSDVLFDFDSDQLKPEAEESLRNLHTLISETEVLEVTIVGHTDARGSDEYNLELSRRRAVSVSDWLIMNELDAGLFRVEGRGENEPIAPNENDDGTDNPEGRALNRRVDITIRTRQPLS